MSFSAADALPEVLATPEAESRKRAAAYLGGFVVLNAAIRFLLLDINMAEYTDGILQITVFKYDAGLYPPLYGGLATLLSLTGLDLELAAKIVSVVASTLTVIPIYLMARLLHSDHAGRFAALFFTLSPLVLRWSVRVMTDALFLCLCSYAIYFGFKAWLGSTDRKRMDRNLAWAMLFGAASVLTRYHGGFVALLLLIPVIRFVVRHRAFPWRTALASVTWLALPYWLLTRPFAHADQFKERTSGEWLATLLSYLNLFESFVLILPYFFGFPLFLFFLTGLFKARFAPGTSKKFYSLFAAWAFMILLLQSMFGSFQQRYMLPLYPFLLVLAGAGAAWAESRFAMRGKQRVFSLLLMATLIYLGVVSCAVLVFQRQAFGDQKQAAMFVRSNVPEGATIVANEQYGAFEEVGCAKLRFWIGRPVEPVHKFLPAKAGQAPQQHMPRGTIVILSNFYGGDDYLDFQMEQLTYFYRMRLLTSFDAALYPITDDVMVNSIGNQNPIGWVFRYALQAFTTHVYVVDGRRTQEQLQEMFDRQMAPPGTRPMRGPDGRLTISDDHITSRSRMTTSPL